MKKLIIYTIIILTIGLIPCWIQYNGFMLTSDFLNQQIPFIIETKRMLGTGLPFWSWNTYFGDNFIAAYSFYTLTSPFVWINCLFPLEYIYESITFTLYLKFICLAIVSYTYFKKINISSDNSIIGSLLYVFSSYTIINIGYYHFMEPMICFPILLWSIEKFLRQEKFGKTYLCLASFLVFFSNYYFAPCSLLPASIYFLFRIKTFANGKLKLFSYAFFLIIIGGLLASFILIPTLLHLSGGPRTEINFTNLFNNHNFIWKLCSFFFPTLKEGEIPLLGIATWSSNNTNIAIFGFCLAALYIWKNRSSWVSQTLCILIFLYLTPFNGLFSLFTNIEYTRWAYALTFMIVLATIKYLETKETIKKKTIIIYTCLCLCLCLYRYFIPITWRIYKNVTFINDEIPFTIIYISLILVSLVLLYAYQANQNKTRLIYIISFFSILHLNSFLFARSDKYSTLFLGDQIKIGIFDTYIRNNRFPYVNSNNNNHRNYFCTRKEPYYSNISLLKNSPGVICYNSIQNNKIRKLFLCADSTNSTIRNSFCPNINITSFNTLMSVRDVIKYNDIYSTMSLPEIEDLKESNENYNRYASKYYIPFGFTYEQYILQSSVDSLLQISPKPDIPLIMLSSLAIKKEDEDIIKNYIKPTTIQDSYDIDKIVKLRNKETCTETKLSTTGFKCQSNLKEKNLIFFSVPSDEGFKATIDGIQTKIYEVNCGLSAILAPAGKHEIQFSYIPKGLFTGITISIIALIILGIIIYSDYTFPKTTKNDI